MATTSTEPITDEYLGGTIPPGTDPLLPHHRQALAVGSGLTEDVIAERGYRSVADPTELEQLGFAEYQRQVPTLLIPLCQRGRVVGYQHRPDVPRVDADGKVIKYESRAGSAPLLDLHPRAVSWLGGRGPYFFTEGTKKADSAVTRGAVCFALNGVWGWMREKAPLEDLYRLDLAGRYAYLVFDSDLATKPPVRKALDRLRAFLADRGAKPVVLYLPPGPNGAKTGLDDYFVAGGTPQTLIELTTPPPISVWDRAVDVVDFLGAQEQAVAWVKKNITARGVLTEIYSPRGIGKTNITYAIAKECVDRGFRVLLLDRDNPPYEIRRRLRRWGLAGVPRDRFRVLTRDEVPRLTDAAAWASFPIGAYDLVIVDALDSAAEGVGEQDSKQPSKAIAVLLDITRRENGPGMITLGNTVRTGKHSRGSGVVEDRGDIVYEVRDATGLKPTGEKDWWLELPKASADAWGERTSRRRGQAVFRLAFVPSKFRVGGEPDPFVLEMDLSGETWRYRDVTSELLATVGQTVETQQRAKQRRTEEAVLALQAAIRQAVADGKPLKKGDAETVLIQASGSPKISQAEARSILTKGNMTAWRIKNGPGKGSPLCLFPVGVDMVNEERERGKETP